MLRPLFLVQPQARSRLRFQVATSWRLIHVATSFFQVATSWSFTYVATSFPCRDLVPAHSGISRSRHRNPCRDLPHYRPCRDIKSMSRRRFRPTKADQVATPIPGCNLSPNKTQSYPAQRGRDMKFMSQPRPTSPNLNQTRSRPNTGIW